MSNEEEIEEILAHFGVKGQKWGVRRNKTTGVRPIAKTLNDSAFGRAGRASVKRHQARQTKKAEKAKKKAQKTRWMTPEQKLQLGLIAGVAALSGAAKVAQILQQNGPARASRAWERKSKLPGVDGRKITNFVNTTAREGRSLSLKQLTQGIKAAG